MTIILVSFANNATFTPLYWKLWIPLSFQLNKNEYF